MFRKLFIRSDRGGRQPVGTFRRRVRLQLEQLETRAVPATHIWSGGAADSLFSSAANWDDNSVPGPGDTIIFDATSTKTAVVDAAFGGSVAEMDITPGYTGTILLQRDLSVTSHLVQAGGTVDGSSNLAIPDGAVFDWLGAVQAGSGTTTIAAGAQLNIDGVGQKTGGPLTVLGRTIDNRGEVAWGIGNIAALGASWTTRRGPPWICSGTSAGSTRPARPCGTTAAPCKSREAAGPVT
jgi:hypothetical protein